MKPAKWTTIASQPVFSTPIFTLHQHRRRHHRHGEHDFWVMECGDWVNIIPITREGQVVMVRQYRHGTEDLTLEIPGGMMDPEDGTALAAARREMWEETGYDSPEISELGRVRPNPAIQTNYCHSFLARDARLTRRPRLDGTEDIEVVLVGREEIAGLIVRGEISHALVITAFAFLDLYHPASRQV
ncbi:MAG TPA: NUDIX hydrolase [Candidatus Binataceae bacterium]|nr:NUDIX hydrolase [Candidatus Binataceae bacterium]